MFKQKFVLYDNLFGLHHTKFMLQSFKRVRTEGPSVFSKLMDYAVHAQKLLMMTGYEASGYLVGFFPL